MKILDLKQGSPEWRATRTQYRCASDAPVMMGASNLMSRSEFVSLKATGTEREFSDWEQKNLLDKGHAAELASRPFVEQLIGEDLYPVTGADEDGWRLLASFDGITMSGDTGFEHKLWNEDLAAAVRAGELPPKYYWQLEQQCLVGGLARVIFVCSDGTPQKRVHMEYRPVPGRAKRLIVGWQQFEEDVANYQHVEVLPSPIGREIPKLPALTVHLKGEVTDSNLAIFKAEAMRAIALINTELKEDQDFADAEKAVKFCADAEGKLEAVKDHALGQTRSIDELFKTMDEVKEALRAKRLSLEKLVEARKKSIRAEIMQGGVTALMAHVVKLNARWPMSYMPPIQADFAGAMKGKKTIAGLRDGVATTLAHAKIAANEIADKIDANLKTVPDEYSFLFADLRQLVQKEPDDFKLAVKARIEDHKAAEERRRQADAARQTAAAANPKIDVAKVERLFAMHQTVVKQQAEAAFNEAMALRKRPSDAEIIAVLANHFNVGEAAVIEWLGEMETFNTTTGA